MAYAFLRNQRRMMEMSQLLGVIALGSQGDPKAIQEQIKKWDDEQ